jgi:hypothetical protein
MVTIYYLTYGTERQYAFASARFMSAYPWVQDIILVHTDRIRPNFEVFPIIPKVSHYWEYFGGIGINNKDGIDEVAARNTGVVLASLKTTDWIMQCDSDEIFLAEPDFDFNELALADAVLFEMYHFLQINKYRTEGLCIFDGLYDPHIRLWRKSLNLRHGKPSCLLDGCDNVTAHTHFNPDTIEYVKMQRRLAHIHFRDLTPDKYRGLDNLEGVQWDIQWPDIITKSIKWRT